MSDASQTGGSPPPATRDDEDAVAAPASRQQSEEDPAPAPAPAVANDDDDDSDVLSEIDDDVFEEEYNPDTARVEERDYEDIAKSLKASKRKRADGDAAPAARRPKEGRREKKRRTNDEGAGDSSGQDGHAASKRGSRPSGGGGRRGGGGAKARSPEPEVDESTLDPKERRRRALARAMDAAGKSTSKRRRKKDEVDLEEMEDEEIADLKISMENACIADNKAREEGRPAVEKLRLLPQVVALLNRNTIQHAVLDPETNFLQSIRFFLEPLNDGSLPAYNIQREIFTALTRLPVEKEALLSSGIGKVVLFYTKSKRPEPGVKRMAERLIGEWSRPILKRTDDFRKRHIETRDFDYVAAKQAQEMASFSGSQAAIPARGVGSSFEAEIQRKLAPKQAPNRARGPGLPQTYTIAPNSTFDGTVRGGLDHRPLGAGGMEAFRKMTQKTKGKR